MDLDLPLALAGLLVGFVVGLTGMGGGALMTPVLVIFFNVPPLAAVSSDLVASLVMKPIGGAVHSRRGTVNWGLVRWLAAGSIPAAFAGVLVLKALGGEDAGLQDAIKVALGVALLAAAAGIVLKALLALRTRVRAGSWSPPPVVVRPVPTLLVGIVGGLIVGMTSVGSGSLMIVALLFLYPGLTAAQVVGTDLVQAVPLVAAAALGHLLFGDVQLGLTTSLLIGAVPGVYVGARVSSRAPQALVRRALVVVLVASAAKLLGADNVTLLVVVGAAVVLGPLLWALAHHTGGLTRPPTAVSVRQALRLLGDAATGRATGGRAVGPAPQQPQALSASSAFTDAGSAGEPGPLVGDQLADVRRQ